MRPHDNLEETYDWCVSEGNIIPVTDQFIQEKVISSLNIINEDLLSAQDAVKNKRWNTAYKLYYDILHQLSEAFILLEKIKVKNHVCLFTYLCIKHPELEFNWEFFEHIRTKRNGLHYYATPITEKDWHESKLQFTLYINSLKVEIQKKLNLIK